MFTEAHCIVSGKVQRVGYRDFVCRAAVEIGVVGYARNCEDGTVEAVGQGTPEELKAFIEFLHEGSVLARVDAVAVDWRSPSAHFTDFEVRA